MLTELAVDVSLYKACRELAIESDIKVSKETSEIGCINQTTKKKKNLGDIFWTKEPVIHARQSTGINSTGNKKKLFFLYNFNFF